MRREFMVGENKRYNFNESTLESNNIKERTRNS